MNSVLVQDEFEYAFTPKKYSRCNFTKYFKVLKKMSARFKFPPASVTQTVTPDLEVIPPAINNDNVVGANRIYYDQDCTMPDHIAGFTDGHRLFVISSVNDRFVDNSYIFYFYAFGLVFLFVSILMLFGEGEAETGVYIAPVLATILLPYAIIVTIIKRKIPLNQFVVFDRDSGNVLFTGRKKWPDMVVPFEHVGCFTDHAPGRGAFHFIAKLECRMRPKAMKKGRRMELYVPSMVSDWKKTMQQWAYLNRFMDKSQPIPREPISAWGSVEWFQERNITMDDVMKKYGYVEDDPKTEWFKWDDTAPSHQPDANPMGIKS